MFEIGEFGFGFGHFQSIGKREWEQAKRRVFRIGYGKSTHNKINDPKTNGLETSKKKINDIRKTLEPEPFGANSELQFGFGACLRITNKKKHFFSK
jgi:hypothetical protein